MICDILSEVERLFLKLADKNEYQLGAEPLFPM